MVEASLESKYFYPSTDASSLQSPNVTPNNYTSGKYLKDT